MADLLLMGMTHYPLLGTTDAEMGSLLRTLMKDPAIPDGLAEPAQWPEAMRNEWGTDDGATGAAVHRQDLLDGFAASRKALDAFDPDVLLVWGDDQYENFKEDIVPPYALLAYDDIDTQPWQKFPWPNVWGEPKDRVHTVKGRPDIARWLAGRLLDDGIDVSYAYKPLHMQGLAHAFMNTQLFLDYERVGFPWPMVCMPINCYGRKVISAKGFFTPFGSDVQPDPPSPSPKRLMDVGASVARHLLDSQWRVAIVASSSWSHAFLTDKTWRLVPDTASDKAHYEALVAGNYGYWESTTTAAIEDAGQQEMLNWFALFGAARELGVGGPEDHRFIETHCFNSNKVFARWPVVTAASRS
jgi:hypothetical protein